MSGQKLRLLQVCNVGNIVGGTAACAWTVARALPDCHHIVCFRSMPTRETITQFRKHAGVEEVLSRRCLREREIQSHRPDLILLHNIGHDGVQLPEGIPTMQYVHSQISPVAADHEIHCSHWLARERGKADDTVCWQGVPLATDETPKRSTGTELTIGRICTPTKRKWPESQVAFYADLARRNERVHWEFIGCPSELQSAIQTACVDRGTFLDAAWSARRHVARWDAILYHHPTLSESFGRTVAEAMRVGTIPIVDNRGGFVEQLTPEVGFLCQHPTEFSHAIEQLQDIRLRREMSIAARERGNAQFSLRAFRARLLEWFGTL